MIRIENKYFSAIKDMPLVVSSKYTEETLHTLEDYVNDINKFSPHVISHFIVVSGYKIHICDKNDKLIDFWFYNEKRFPTSGIKQRLIYLRRKDILGEIL